MPRCQQCQWLRREEQSCGVTGAYPGKRSPIRNCIIAIVEEYATLFCADDKILEIGCGTWAPLKTRSEGTGSHWVGIDVRSHDRGKKAVASVIATVEAIPYASGTFDWVVATQSMEHWEESRVNISRALSEVFRVLKPGGWALFNVPIYLHGSSMFMFGHYSRIESHLKPFSANIKMEEWRNPPDPLPRYNPASRFYWFKPSFKKKSAYILDIRAQRNPEVPYFPENGLTWWQRAREEMRYRTPFFYLTVFAVRLKRKFQKVLK